MAYCSSETDQEHKPLRQPPALLATQPSFTVGANRSVATCAGSGVLWTTITIFVISYVNSSTLSRAPPRLAVEHKVYVVIGSPRQRATRGRVMPTAKLATQLVVESPSSFVRDKKSLALCCQSSRFTIKGWESCYNIDSAIRWSHFESSQIGSLG